ncbi:dTDP-4-dehydrorhamnose 3,5-epimerase [Hansschlegelia zhihuaiae]|uniref:dTDP-4-dehydrorhamnose 3,5-epimerase n=1 Tax=Hansschlegelia zhihuaiae TaxID=405005 RepID=A0A4Q0MDD0_9HYPH|nr:dTDP-4-dehydrorhamnose 3,5-epimerase [Hansschlegelia zhihuaiae]RXF70929.1 dTDP-4-dehydrorhamnose 3,5-epimerase [Hansschlegelia zhihuaiae]
MKFQRTDLADVVIVVLESYEDERGSFARTFCRSEFAAANLPVDFVQASRSSARRAGTVRGLHFQRAPHSEGKLVRCGRGALYDVVIDLRPGSVSFRRWQAFILNAENMLSLYIPPGCAHGFQTLEDDTETLYQMTVAYAPDHAAGVRYDDPSLSIPWPLPVSVISQRDLALPSLDAEFAR